MGEVSSGTWFDLELEWSERSLVELDLTVAGRIVRAPGDAAAVAILRGPLVLAFDADHWDPTNGFLWLTPGGDLTERCASSERLFAARLAFESRPTHYFDWSELTLPFADFASTAAHSAVSDSRYRVWIPQPFFDGSSSAAETA